MTVARLLIAAPIPPPDAWIVGAELPAGYMILRSLTISPRRDTDVNRHGSDLVAAKDMQALPSQLERLLHAFERCDAAGRAELLKLAEIMAGAR